MVIINLQKTPYDSKCKVWPRGSVTWSASGAALTPLSLAPQLRIFARCDDVMRLLLAELALAEPEPVSSPDDPRLARL